MTVFISPSYPCSICTPPHAQNNFSLLIIRFFLFLLFYQEPTGGQALVPAAAATEGAGEKVHVSWQNATQDPQPIKQIPAELGAFINALPGPQVCRVFISLMWALPA